MRVSPVSSGGPGYESDPSEVVQRFQNITRIIGEKRRAGAEEVSLLLRSENDVDSEVITRLSRLYNVSTESNNGPSVRVNVRFR